MQPVENLLAFLRGPLCPEVVPRLRDAAVPYKAGPQVRVIQHGDSGSLLVFGEVGDALKQVARMARPPCAVQASMGVRSGEPYRFEHVIGQSFIVELRRDVGEEVGLPVGGGASLFPVCPYGVDIEPLFGEDDFE